MMAKAVNETEEVPEPVEEVAEEPVVAEAAPAPQPGKRQLGVKEPIVFKWKILGASEGVILTLFKGVEREEVDAQLERLHKEGYYKDLRAVDINEKVVQPKPPPPPTPLSARSTKPPKPSVKKKSPAPAPEKKAKEPVKAKAAVKEKSAPKDKKSKPAAETKAAKKKTPPAPKKKKK